MRVARVWTKLSPPPQSHRKAAAALHLVDTHPLWLSQQLHAVQCVDKRVEQFSQFRSGQRGSEAVVQPVAEGEVTVRMPVQS